MALRSRMQTAVTLAALTLPCSMQALVEGAKVYGDADAVQKLVGDAGGSVT